MIEARSITDLSEEKQMVLFQDCLEYFNNKERQNRIEHLQFQIAQEKDSHAAGRLIQQYQKLLTEA